MRNSIPIVNIIMPTLVFWAVYRLSGILPAVMVSIFISAGSVFYAYIKKKQLSNTQVLGLVGLILSGVSITFSGNEKFYYIPALISNIVLFGFMIALTIRGKSVFLYLAEDFQVKALQNIPEQDVFILNYLWLAFFFLKCASKIIGLVYLDFGKLYWLVFLLGDPAMLIVIGISVLFIRKKVKKTP